MIKFQLKTKKDHEMKITILGSGTSAGVPFIGCKCEICTSNNIYNKRLRSSCFIEFSDGVNILIDTSQDFREQMLKNNISKVDAVLYTHEHADHLLGIVDLRSFNFLQKKAIDIYAQERTLNHIQSVFSFCFYPPQQNWSVPALIANKIIDYQEFKVSGHEFIPLPFPHGKIMTTGYIIDNKFAYIVDFNDISTKNLEILKEKNLELIIFDCESFEYNSSTHPHLSQIIKWSQYIQPQRVILTHMGHTIDYEIIKKYLVENQLDFIKPAYDGLSLVLS